MVNLRFCVVLEDLGEADLISVSKVVHILEERLLFRIRLVVVLVLS